MGALLSKREARFLPIAKFAGKGNFSPRPPGPTSDSRCPNPPNVLSLEEQEPPEPDATFCLLFPDPGLGDPSRSLSFSSSRLCCPSLAPEI